MKDYTALFSNLPDTEFKAKDVGIASATLTAMVRRGLLQKVNNSSPYIYSRAKGRIKLINLSTAYVTAGKPDYITLHFENKNLPMLGTFKNEMVYDCYGNKCDIQKITKIEVFKEGKSQTFLI